VRDKLSPLRRITGDELVQSGTRSAAVDSDRAWHIYLVFDGGSLGNPGKGYGSYVYKGLVTQMEPAAITFPGITTNNEAEYMTLIKGLESVLAALESNGLDPSALHITIKSDSKLVVEQISGRWKIKKAELRPLVQMCQSLLGKFKSWDATWHPRSESVRILGH
jgi:ribonuclease HI